jgi:hypothetical protein
MVSIVFGCVIGCIVFIDGVFVPDVNALLLLPGGA